MCHSHLSTWPTMWVESLRECETTFGHTRGPIALLMDRSEALYSHATLLTTMQCPEDLRGITTYPYGVDQVMQIPGGAGHR